MDGLKPFFFNHSRHYKTHIDLLRSDLEAELWCGGEANVHFDLLAVLLRLDLQLQNNLIVLKLT